MIYLSPIIALLLAIAFVLVPEIVLFRAGLRHWRAAAALPGERAEAMRYLALNLCEPLINTILVTALVYAVASQSAVGVLMAFCSLPMAVLLLPARGLRFADPAAFRAAAQTLALGVARWIFVILTLAAAFAAPNDDALPPMLGLTLALAPLALLLMYASGAIATRISGELAEPGAPAVA